MAGRDMESDFTAYFTARVVPLRRLAYALCGDWHTAEDLVQITFVKLYRQWRRVRRETIDAYARRILVNAFLTRIRGAHREQAVAQVPDQPAPSSDQAAAIDLGRALASLPPRQRAMVVLRHLEDLSVADVADLLGITEGAVKSQTARGLQNLRDALEAAAVTEGMSHG